MTFRTLSEIYQRKWDRITDPVDALEAVLANRGFLGSPVFEGPLLEMVERVARANKPPPPTHLTTANGVTFAFEPKDA